jgi:uncharacterized membrane protein YfcA
MLSLGFGLHRNCLSYDERDLITTHLFALALALLIGVSLGALGAGGSIVTLPVLVYVAGIEPKQAVGMSLAIVGFTSTVGSWLHSRHGNFYWRAALFFGGAGMVGSYISSGLTHLVPSSLLVILFAVVMLVSGVLMFTGRAVDLCDAAPCSLQRFLATGFAVGLLSGFLGVGGGFLIVPALVWFTGLDTKRAVGTSLAVIALNSVSGLVGQLRYARWDWVLTEQFIAVSLVGMGFGVVLASRTPDRLLRRVFAVAVIAIATAMCINIGRS